MIYSLMNNLLDKYTNL